MTNLKAISQSVDVVDLLTRLEIQFKTRGDELEAKCMSGRHDDKTPSWRIHNGGDKNGLFYCFPCHWGGTVFDLVMKVKDCGFPEAKSYVEESAKKTLYKPEDDDLYSRTFEHYEPPGIKEPLGLRTIKAGTPCMRYLADRGFGATEIREFGLMDWQWRGRLYIPVKRNGLLIAWDARSYNGDNPKVLTPTGNTEGSQWGLFGLDQADRSNPVVHVVEGWADALRLRQAGLPNPHSIRGSRITEQQVSELSWVSVMFAWQEGDVAGRVMVKEIKQWFVGKRVEVIRMPKGMDPADFRPGELITLFTGGESWQK